MSPAVIDRLVDAINKHDLDAMTACFDPDFGCVWPAHPARSFTGRDQVRRNWETVFRTRPNVKATVAGHARTGDEIWAEWEFVGTEQDGTPWHQRGVIVVVINGDVIAQARFYMEPVEPPAA